MKEFFRRNPKQPEGVKGGDEAQTEHAPMFAWNKQTPKSDSPKNTNNIPDNLWIKCPKCHELVYTKEFENNKKVCSKCGYHNRLSARERVLQLTDEDTFEELDAGLITADPLGFTSLTEPPYGEKMEQARKKSGLNEALLTGLAKIENQPVALAICDFSFQGGTMGGVFGEKIARLVDVALERKCGVLTISASGGARMHEGLFSLMQMAKTIAALARLGEKRLPHLSLFTDPTLGGVTASYASVADVIMAEPGAVIGFAGTRVIEQTTKQKLPPGFQTAEFLLEHGMLDMLVPRRELKTVISNLLNSFYLGNRQFEKMSTAGEIAYAR